MFLFSWYLLEQVNKLYVPSSVMSVYMKLFGLCVSFWVIVAAENGKNCWHLLTESAETVSHPKGTERKIK